MRLGIRTGARRTQVGMLIVVVLVVWAALLYLFKPLSDHTGEPQPPDLSQCTRVTVRMEPSVLAALDIAPSLASGVLSPEEWQYLESLEEVAIDDPEHIRTLAADIALAAYYGRYAVKVPFNPVYHIAGYRDDKLLTSFLIRGPVILTEDRHMFRRHPSRRDNASLTPPVVPFARRLQCAQNLYRFNPPITPIFRRFNIERDYPTGPQWCDLFVADGNEERTSRLVCPSAGEGKCHYALNPNCDPNSPGDTVLMFETKAGWNQRGGPELFTFDNHDPQGGCVLLNDGTVRFIRTRAELHALHWQPARYVILDDFESYDDRRNRVYDTWLDGFVNDTGSTVGYFEAPFAEKTIVHGGRQAMPLQYDNSIGPFRSVASRIWADAQDWTTQNANALALHVRGTTANQPSPLYVGIKDKAGRAAFVAHSDPNVLTATEWIPWSIPLGEFASVDMTGVKEMIIRIGDPDDSAPGGKGIVYIDDIRLPGRAAE